MLEDWELEDPSAYSPDKFYTSTGKGKESVSTGVRLALYMHKQIEILLRSGKYPALQTYGDFVRDACYHRMRYLQQNEPDTDQVLSQLRIMQANADRERRMADFQEVAETTAKNIKDDIRRGFEGRARTQLEDVLRDLPAMRDSYWIEIYLGLLEEQLGKIFPVRQMFRDICDGG
jgi:Arc/MetJ-type ribon-helix-helix transcriptional regulator